MKLSQEYGIENMPLGSCVCLNYQAGETVLRQDMPLTHLLIVVSGKVKVCLLAKNGKDLILCYYVSAGVMGDMEMMTGAPVAAATVIAVSDFECIGLSIEKNAASLKRNLVFLNRLGQGLSAKLMESSKNFVSTALFSGEERLCAYILEASHNDVFSDTLTDVSRSIGMSYRHMFRLLNQLCVEGLLDKKPYGYRILDHEELVRRAAGTF